MKRIFSRETILKRSSVDVNCSFESPAKYFLPEVRNVFTQNTKQMRNFILLQKVFSLEFFPWTLNLQLGQACQNFSANLDNFLKVKSKNHEKIFTLSENNIKISKRSSVDVNCSSDKPAELLLSKVAKNLAQSL